MFTYDASGLPIGYVCSQEYPESIRSAVEAHMLGWIRECHGQMRRRIGKVGIMQGSSPNLDRMEHE
jgi:hypothetical protein